MATADEGCLYIAVDETEFRDDTSIPGIIAGGIVGFIVGCLVGFLIFKLCSSGRGCFSARRAVAAEVPQNTKAVQPFMIYENAYVNDSAKKLVDEKIEKEVDDADSIKNQNKLFVLSDFLADMTWEGMTLELGKRHLVELFTLELSTWEERHACLIQQYHCALNDLVSKKVITEAQHHDILSSEEKRLSVSLAQIKKNFYKYQQQCMDFNGKSLIDLFGSLQDSYMSNMRTMNSEYRESSNRFSHFVSRVIGQEDEAIAHREILMHQLDMVEGIFRKTQDELLESFKGIFKDIGSVIKELAIILVTDSEMNRILDNKCRTSLEKLVKTGRISSHTKEKVEDSFQFEFHITKEDVQEVLSDMNPSILAHYESNLQIHEKESEDARRSILAAYENQTSSDGFVESYLDNCCENKQHRMSVEKSFINTEISEFMRKASLLSQYQGEKRLGAIDNFCLVLKEIDALSDAELHHLKQDFKNQMEMMYAKVSSTSKRNVTELWRLYEDYISKRLQEENHVDSSILQDSVTDDLLSLEGLLHLQTNLSESDFQMILQERESLFLLIVNQINTFRAKWFHVVENDLAKNQAFLLMKRSEDLASGTIAELFGMLQRLWNERNSMKNYVQEIVTVSCIREILSSSHGEICKIISQTLVKNLSDEEVASESEKLIFEEVESALVQSISMKDSLSTFGALTKDHNEKLGQLMKQQLDRHSISLAMTEETVRALQIKRQGRLTIKAQKIAQYRPPSGPSPRDIQPYLDQILLQNQVARAVESVDSESVRHILLERLVLDKSAISDISDLSRSSAASLLAKFAVLVGLSKSEYTSCVSRAKKPYQGRGQKGTQKFHKYWKDAVVYAESNSG